MYELLGRRMLAEAPKGKNTLLSPLGAGYMMSQLHAAAGGQTAAEICRAAAITKDPDPSRVDLASFARGFKDGHAQVALAARTYVSGPYRAPGMVEAIDIASDPASARDTMNRWVAGQTKGGITDFLGPRDVNESTRVVVVNAIYFKAQWKTPFVLAQTGNLPFGVGTRRHAIPTMRGVMKTPYADLSERYGFTMARFPFAGDFTMTVYLPAGTASLGAIETEITGAAGYADAMGPRNLRVRMPKFRIDGTCNFRKVMERLNIRRLFTAGRAELPGYVPAGAPAIGDLYVARARQRCAFEVDENGAEGTQATYAAVRSKGVSTGFRDFYIDRPFIFTIERGNASKRLFIGRVVNP